MIGRRAFLAFPAILAASPARAEDARTFMDRAFAMRRLAEETGDQPYGAVIVQDGRIIGEAPSRVIQRNDPSAHAEREAIRDAQRWLGRTDLAGATLYSSSRPCALCEAAAAQAGVTQMIHGTQLTDAGTPQGPATGEALIAAAARGDAAEITRLLKAGAPIEARDGSGRTALLAATHGNHVAAARALMEAGADVNAKDSLQDSAFLYAGAEGRLEILLLTLRHGADLASVNRYGGTALIPAAHHGHVENVRALLGTKIAIDHVNRLGWTALLEAVILGDGGPTYQAIVRLLVGAGANVTLADKDGTTPLAHARRRGFAAIAQILEQAGAR